MDVTCLLYMLCKQLREDTNQSDYEYDVDTDDEQDETSDDTSDQQLAPGDSQMRGSHDLERLQLSQARLRSRFLDRLAEVLARVKEEPGEVASAYMVEIGDGGSEQVEIRVAKNEGLSQGDLYYLRDLGVSLERVARGGKSANPQT